MLAPLRVIVLLNALGIAVVRHRDFVHPVAGWTAVGVMVVWTAVAVVAYRAPERRQLPLLGADLAVTLALLAVTPLVKGAGFTSTVPGFWVMGVLLAWAIRWRRAGGLVAGVLIALLDLVLRSDVGATNYGNAFLLVVGGPIFGLLAGSLKQMAAERELAERAAAAAAERARLARVVHDGVLQVLALVQRRGTELGGEAAELGRLAGEQEAALRNLIRAQDAVGGPPLAGEPTTADLAAALGALGARPGVDVAVPGGAVPMGAGAVDELTAVVAACLDNVTRHVGEGAPAWVLLEAFGDRVEVSVRDDGPGIPAGRLAQAAAEGRLGVAESIKGRVRDLGGTARVTSGSFGTEWEIVVPRTMDP